MITDVPPLLQPLELGTGAAQGRQRGCEGRKAYSECTVVVGKADEAAHVGTRILAWPTVADLAGADGDTALGDDMAAWPRKPTDERPNWHLEALA